MVEGSTTGVGISSSILGEGYWILDGLRDGPDFESASGYRWTGVCGAACARSAGVSDDGSACKKRRRTIGLETGSRNG
jgi:hypothetical protein